MFLRDPVFLKSTVKISCTALLVVMGLVLLFSNHSASKPNESLAKELDSKRLASTDGRQEIACDSESGVCCGPNLKALLAVESKPKFSAIDPLLVASADDAKVGSGEEEKVKLSATQESQADPFGNPTTTSTRETSDIKKSSKPDAKPAIIIVDKPAPYEASDWNSLSNEEKIERVLQAKVTCLFDGATLADIADALSDTMHVDASVDVTSLTEAQTDPQNSRFDIRIKYPRQLKHVLNEALQARQLGFIIANDALTFVSDATKKSTLTTKVFQVVDLVTIPSLTDDENANKHDFESLINLIETTMQPKSWKDISGDENGGSLDKYDTMLVIRNTSEVLQGVQELFDQLRITKSKNIHEMKKTSDVAPEQPDKIVRKIYHISDLAVESLRSKITRRIESYGAGCIEPEDEDSIYLPNSENNNAKNSNEQSANGTANTTSKSTSLSTKKNSTQSVFLTIEQQKNRVDSLLKLIPEAIAPKEWEISGVSIKNLENRLIIVQKVAVQDEVAKLLRGLKVLRRVETW